MAKSSLQFLERRNVDVYNTDSYAIRSLVKEDCGKVIVLANAKGHTLTLPTADEAGEGWNCRFIVGAVQTDRSVRDLTTIAAQGTETVSLVAPKTGGSLDAGVLAAAQAIDLASFANGDIFTMTVPTAAGGTGTTFTFTVVADDAAVTAATQAAGQFFLAKEGSDAQFAAAVKALIAGEADTAPVTVKKPASGEGSGVDGAGIQGVTPTVTNSDKVTITAVGLGTAGGTIAFVNTNGGVVSTGNLSAVGGATLGVNRTGISLSTRTLQITEGATKGDQIELAVVNGQWQARSIRAQ